MNEAFISHSWPQLTSPVGDSNPSPELEEDDEGDSGSEEPETNPHASSPGSRETPPLPPLSESQKALVRRVR
eukprot:12614153-Heterocapsa_arctica.AAC.1